MENFMGYSNGNSAAQLLEAHEDRIQRVERDVAELAKQSAEAILKINFLCQKVDALGEKMSEKLDSSVHDIAQKVEEIAHTAQRAQQSAESLSASVSALEEINTKKEKNWEAIKKIAYPLIIAAASVGATQFGQIAWDWLTR